MARGRTVTGVAALLAGAMLALAGNEIARADQSTAPFPPAVVAAPAPAPPQDPPVDEPVAPGPAGSDRSASDPGPAEPDPPASKPATEPAPDEPDPTGPAAGDRPAEPPKTGPAAEPAEPADPPKKDPATAQPKARAPAAPTTAAERYDWGTPLPGSDEFDYTGKPDPGKWSVAGECWAGHAGNGGRCASRSTVDGSKLVQTGLANGNSAWLASRIEQRYGRWEARVRSTATGPDKGRQYHPLLIIWPSSNRWPQDGEYDFLENGAPGQDCAESFIHYPHNAGSSVQQVFTKERNCGAPLSEWHNVAFEWTPDHVRGYIDGKQWFDLSGGANGIRKRIQDMPSGHLTIQLDNFYGGNMQPATYEVDWVRIYRLH
jgi:hypothetical protein